MEYNSTTQNNRTYKFAFAGYPEVVMYDTPKGKPIQHLIFGDYINLLPDKDQSTIKEDGDFVYIRSRSENGWIRKDKLQKERLLEINFVDIGQGDGCHIVTPDDRVILIDAGIGENMYHFIRWRYNLKKEKNRMDNAISIISHPDADHYKGFSPIFTDKKISISNIFHNGLVERGNGSSQSSIGGFTKINGKKFVTGIVTDDASMKAIINDKPQRNSFSANGKESPLLYPTMLYQATINDCNKGMTFTMLEKNKKYVPGFESGQKVSLEILGPITEMDANGKPCLKYFSDKGKTKNGHSVLLMLKIGKLKVLLGGDLNVDAENYLLEHYTGMSPDTIRAKLKKENDPQKITALKSELETVTEKGRSVFEAHIAKACHHGSHHFTTEFLRSVNSIATIISSGDNESYAHPRPDALGAFGKYGRGERPLIFSTELARSPKEQTKKPYELEEEITKLVLKAEKETDRNKKTDLNQKIDDIFQSIGHSVAVYGMINVRTDGNRVIICQKLERERSPGQKWDIHELVWDEKTSDYRYKIKLDD